MSPVRPAFAAIRRIATWLAVLLVLLVATWLVRHRTLIARMATYPRETPILSVSWYEPMERVRGADDSLALPNVADADRWIAVDARRRASDYAVAKGSSALLALVDGQVVIEEYYGGHTRDATTNSFSMAKTILALLIGVAVEEGRIGGIDESIARYIPEWAGDARADIRLEDLLWMQSGLRNDDDREDPFSDMVQVHLSEDLLPVVLAIPPARPPGQEFEYNNLNSQVLGLALERATGVRYAEYLSTRLWRGIGAGDASLWLDRDGGRAKTYCCVFATGRDWARVGELLRNRGRVGDAQVIPPAWIETMLQSSPFNPRYGRHVWLHAAGKGDDEPAFFYLDGGRKQRVYVVPSLALVVVRVGEQARGWDDTELPWTLARGVIRARSGG